MTQALTRLRALLVRGVALTVLPSLLFACGGELAGAAATTAKLEATQAEQAKAQKAQLEKKLGQALKATEASASAAADQ